MNVLDIHTQVLQRSLWCQAPEADKIPFKGLHPDPATIEQPVCFHQPVHLLVVDDPAFFFWLSGDISIPVTTELLGKAGFNIPHHFRVVKELTAILHRMCTGQCPFRSTGPAVIKTTWTHTTPTQQPADTDVLGLIFLDQAQRLARGASLFFKAPF